MQTFLPLPPELNPETGYHSFKNSARVLDNKRLGKQRVEGYQILILLCGKDSKWKNHPAVLQWKGWEWILWDYVCDMCLVWKDRGFKDTIYEKVDQLVLPGDETATIGKTLPPWMGNTEFHASHRSRLLFKGRVDTAVKSLKSFLNLPKVVRLQFWLASDDCPCVMDSTQPNTFSQNDIQQIEEYLIKNNVVIPPNHYAQFGWQEPDNIPYVWPVRKEK